MKISLISFQGKTGQIERKNVEIKPLIASWNLGDGESEAITFAMENSEYGILDDLQARKCATLLNWPLMGSLGIIVRAKKEGLLEVVKPTFEKLIASGLYVDRQLIEKVLTSIGEK